MITRLSPLSSALLLAMGAPALAASTEETTAPDQSKATVLDSVDVHAETARLQSSKFTASLLDTPKTVAVIDQKVIEQTAATSLLEALRTVPGITFGAGEGGNPTGDRPFIRGFDTQSDIHVDGLRDPGSQTREVFAVEQIDILKGPSSAYGGRGSAGGSISLVSKTPKLDDFVKTSFGLGTDNYRRATVDANAVIGDGIAARLNLMRHDSDIAGRDVVNVSRWGIAPSLAWGLNGPTQFTLNHYHMQTDDLPDAGGFPYDNPFSSGVNLSLNGNGRPIVPDRTNFYGLVDRDFQKTKADITTASLTHDTGAVTLRNITRFGRTHNDYFWTQPDDSKGNPLLYGTLWRRTNTRAVETDSVVNQTSLSAAFDTGTIAHSINTGIEYAEETMHRGSFTVAQVRRPNGQMTAGTNNPLTGNTACATTGITTGYNCTDFAHPTPYDPWLSVHDVSRTDPALDVQQTTRTQSAYLFDTLTFNAHWLLNLGVRYDDYSVRHLTPSATAPTTLLRTHSGFWNGQAGLVYKPSENGSVYLSWGTSSTPVGVDGGDGADSISATIKDLAPQRSHSVELGTKWDLLDSRLTLTGALFKTEMTNARVTSEAGTTENAGTKRVSGIEVGITGHLAEGWQIFGGYTWMDSDIKDNGFVLVNGAYVPSPFNGNQFPNTPKHSASLWTTWIPSFAPRFSSGLGANYVDKQYGNVNNTKWIPGYTRWDAMFGYAFSQRTNLQLNVQNLTNKLYFNKAYSSHYAAIAPGRSATLALNLTF